MRYTTHNQREPIKKFACVAAVAISVTRFVALGLTARQWLVCLLVFAMVSAVFSTPFRVNKVSALTIESSEFEPVNEEISIFNSLLRKAHLEIEARTTPWRAVNLTFDANANEDQKRSGTSATINGSDDKPSTEAKDSEPEPSEHHHDRQPIDSAIPQRAGMIASPPLDDDEFRSSFTPENNLGSPMGQVGAQAPNSAAAMAHIKERVGSANFNFEVPVASLPGRGIDAGISLSYNSRVWNFWQSPIGSLTRYRYNIDNDWLAPGFKMTLGQLTYQNYYNVSLTSPDGTRHQLVYVSGDSYARTYDSTDGTFVRVSLTSASGGTPDNSISVKYADGSSAVYARINSVLTSHYYPTKITDRNGNTIHISYRPDDPNGRISYIRDTLNREIKFYYDSGNKLVAVTVPGFNGGGERQTIRFYYETINFDTTTQRFEGVNHIMPASADVLKYVYFPGTNTGYKYDYSLGWGMIYKISDLRAMQVSSTSLTQTGTVTSEGQAAATTQYNYPLALGMPLTDVPRFTTRTDDWLGRTTSQVPVTQYSVEKDTTASRTRSKITSPDGTITETWSMISPSGWDDGLVTDTFTKTVINAQMQTYKVWAHAKMFWGNQTGVGGRQNPRLLKVEQTNDAAQTRATTFEYDNYNNQTLIKEHDFAAPGTLGTELRKTETTYQTNAGWLNNRLFSLPVIVKTIVNGTVVSRTKFEYDNNGGPASSNLVARSDIDVQTHDARFNWSGGAFDPATDFRGNLTKIIAFSDATLETDPNAVITTMKYDIAGNKVESGASCCKEKEWIFDKVNEYAYPVREKQGDQGQLETSATYDRNTGLAKTVTDENGQVSTLTYSAANLRLTRSDSPNGAWSTIEYNDAVFPYHVKTTRSLDATRSVSSWNFSDGQGRTFRSRSQTALGYLSHDIEFDIMGRGMRSFHPYTVTGLTEARPSNTKFTQTTERDGIGRPLTIVLPDLTTVSSSYNGLVTIATDQAGKTRRKIEDTLGRIIRVDEPDASGNLGTLSAPVQPTHYEYDGNNNLTKVTQSDGTVTQVRSFKYDSLSRLTHDRQVEAVPTLNNEGVKVTSGGLWTGVYKYDHENRVMEGVNADGVKTSFTYDGLNRTTSTSYSGEIGYQTPTVTYSYDEPENGFYNNGKMTKVRTASDATYGIPETVQNFRYNKMGQMTKHTQSIDGQQYQLQYAYNLAGQLVSETYPSGRVVTVGVDEFGATQTISDAARTYLNGITFDNRGSLSQVNLGNGTAQTYTQNDRFQVVSQSFLKGAEVLQKYDYSYGTVDLTTGAVDATKNNGHVGKIESWIGTTKQWSQRFAYDELSRLKEVREYKQGNNAQLTYKQVFDFDRFANLYRKSANNPTGGQENPLSYTPIENNDIDRATNRFATGTSYANVGNVVVDNKFRSMSFGYDANGRMIKVVKAGQSDARTVYDGRGNRVAEKVNDVWQFMVYDALGKLVAEYGGLQRNDEGGVKYLQQDWQGSVRVITNNSGHVIARTDHQAFGEEIGSGVGIRSAHQGYSTALTTRQGYGLTERDESTGLNHTWFRKLENRAGRWTSPDPYKGSMSLIEPQSFNRYSYVTNDPISYVDPSGLYEPCVHVAMTKFIGRAAGVWDVDKFAGYTGAGLEGADSPKYKATSLFNIGECSLTGGGSSPEIHLSEESQLRANIAAYPGHLERGRRGDWTGYRDAAHMIHSIQDAMGAHKAYITNGCLGHGYWGENGESPGPATDRIVGEQNFIAAANKVLQVMSGDPNRRLTSDQIEQLIQEIIEACKKEKVSIDNRYIKPGMGGKIGGTGGGGGSRGDHARVFDWLILYYKLLFPPLPEPRYG